MYVVVGQTVTTRFSPRLHETQTRRPQQPPPRQFHATPRRWWGDVTKFDDLGGGSAIYYEALVDETRGLEGGRWLGKWVVDGYGDLVEVRDWRGHLGDISECLFE